MKIQKNKNKRFFLPASEQYLAIILGFLTFSCSFSLHAAEYIYISDNLRVGVRPEPIGSVPPISVVLTGMRLEVHERTEGYVKITTDKGITGWIKDIYITKKAPAIIQLNNLKKKYDKLKKDLSQGNDATEILEKANIALTEQVNELKAERREWAKERAKVIASQYKETSWLWVIGVVILVVGSFVAGIYWYKNHVMKRLGGLRV